MSFSKVAFYSAFPSLLLSFAACRSDYESYAFKGGYSEQRIDPQTLLLEFKGNSYTSLQEVKSLALRRAAEVCHGEDLNIKELKQSVDAQPDFDTDDCTYDIHGNTVCVEQIEETNRYLRPSAAITLSCAQDDVLSQED